VGVNVTPVVSSRDIPLSAMPSMAIPPSMKSATIQGWSTLAFTSYAGTRTERSIFALYFAANPSATCLLLVVVDDIGVVHIAVTPAETDASPIDDSSIVREVLAGRAAIKEQRSEARWPAIP
jgi:hypothetical protein